MLRNHQLGNRLIVTLVRLLDHQPLRGFFNWWVLHLRQMTLVHSIIGASKGAQRLIGEDFDVVLVL